MWAFHLQRSLATSSRVATGTSIHLNQCSGCIKRQFSTRQEGRHAPARLISLKPKYSFIRKLASTTSESNPPLPDKNKNEEKVEISSDNTSAKAGDTIVKVLATGKAKSVRKKTDFSKDYQDNIYLEYDRAKYEYALNDEQLKDLQVYQRRSPYPGSDNIKVYRRENLVKKAIDVWGNLENLEKERKRRKLWEHVESYRYNMINANKRYFEQHKSSEEEKPYIYRPFSKEKPEQPVASIFKTGPGKVVLWAISVNAANVVIKFAAWWYTGSHSMFSEFIHSVADTVNQVILAAGIHQSLKKADQEHPYGWANFRNVASLISGVGIFCLGAGASIYHGMIGLAHPETMNSLYWGIGILGGSFLSEGGTLLVAVNEVRQAAKRENMSFMDYVWMGRDPSTNVVLLEDAAAVMGVTIAAACMTISHFTGNPIADAMGSIFIGSLLGGVASFIIYTNTIALVGRSIPPQQKAKLMQELENDRMIRALHDVKATDMGGQHVRFKAEVDFDGKEITRLYLEKSDLEALLAEVQTLKTPEDLELFMLKHGENIVDIMGSEVDRIEKNFKSRHPEVRHVDLEQL